MKNNKENCIDILQTIYVGTMRIITLNYKKFCKPVSEGWRR